MGAGQYVLSQQLNPERVPGFGDKVTAKRVAMVCGLNLVLCFKSDVGGRNGNS